MPRKRLLDTTVHLKSFVGLAFEVNQILVGVHEQHGLSLLSSFFSWPPMEVASAQTHLDLERTFEFVPLFHI